MPSVSHLTLCELYGTGLKDQPLLPFVSENYECAGPSYHGLNPTVSMRTVNEAARSVELINSPLNHEPAGPDCSLVFDGVMSCFFSCGRRSGFRRTYLCKPRSPWYQESFDRSSPCGPRRSWRQYDDRALHNSC